MQKAKNRPRGLREAENLCKFRKIKEKIKQAQKTKQGAKTSQINNLLSCSPNFVGCYAENELSNLKLTSFPIITYSSATSVT